MSGRCAEVVTAPEMTDAAARLGQFFTPQPVVEFAYDALELCGASLNGMTVVDPACGPGGWLVGVLQRDPQLAVGCDCDPGMIEAWRASSLVEHPPCLLCVLDALVPEVLPHGHFDLVVGNPPFGTKLAKASERDLTAIAGAYRLWRAAEPLRLLAPGLTTTELARLRRFPLEILFLERFVQLCRPGGWIAIVLPEGIMANARWRYVRRWLLDTVTLRAVVGLPRDTFRRQRTTAKTCLLLAQNVPPPTHHRVALAEVDECTAECFARLLEAWRAGEEMTSAYPDGLLPPPVMRT